MAAPRATDMSPNLSFLKSITVKSAALACVLAAGAAWAPSASARDSEVVVMARIEIDQSDSAREIYADLRRGVTRACRGHQWLSLRYAATRRACIEEMMDKAVDQVGRFDVSQLHDAQMGRATGLAGPAAGARGVRQR
jgi:UrcA family protein